jgi:hypothetical protein
MRQPALLIATLTGSLLFGASVTGALRAPALAMPAVVATTTPTAARDEGSNEGAPGLHAAGAQADALAAAIGAQFPGHSVEVAIDTPLISDAGPAQQQVEALARVRIDGSAPMLVRATALYDREARSADAPSLWFEGTGEHAVSPATQRGLATAAARRLDAEFAGQPVTLAIDDARAVPVGGRYLRVVARGVADFGAEGRASTTIEALYDPRSGEWLRLDYALGADPAANDAALAYAGS